jgi:hypothetical protein
MARYTVGGALRLLTRKPIAANTAPPLHSSAPRSFRKYRANSGKLL